jgi:hypothetical protein
MDEKKFIDLYQRYKNSELCVKAFCENEIIAPSTFYYWKKKLKDKNQLPGFIPVIIDSASSLNHQKSSSMFPQHSTISQSGVPGIEVELPNGIIIRLKNGCDFSMIKDLIQLYR